MFITLLKLLSRTIILLLLMESLDGAPYDLTTNKQTTVYRFGSIYNKKNCTRPVKTSFSTPFDIFGYRNTIIGLSKTQVSPTASSTPKLARSGGETKKYLIDEQILFEVFNKDDYNKRIKNKTHELETSSRIEKVDFTTETNLETTTFDNDTNYDDGYRFGGGIAAQHAAITLIGG